MSRDVTILKPIFQGKVLEKIFFFYSTDEDDDNYIPSAENYIKECHAYYDEFDMIALTVNDKEETVRGYIIPINENVVIFRGVKNKYIDSQSAVLFTINHESYDQLDLENELI